MANPSEVNALPSIYLSFAKRLSIAPKKAALCL
jgi:hypothetical protein